MIDISALIQRVGRHIVQSRTRMSGSRSGFFRTKKLGTGYDFCQLRDYQAGDDVRFIDWKSSARTGKTLLRQWFDEQSRTMHILVDISDSMLYSTGKVRKYDVMVELVAALALMGTNTGDALGLYCVQETLEKTIPPQSGRNQVMRILKELVNLQPAKRTTNLGKALEMFSARCTRRSLLFIISDFIDDTHADSVRMLAKRHEVVVLRVRDMQEESILELCSLFRLHDSERTESMIIDGTHDKLFYQNYIRMFAEQQRLALLRTGARFEDFLTDGTHLDRLLTFVRHAL